MNDINGFIEEAEAIDQYVGSEIDIFIGGISLEERCPRGWDILKEKGIKVKNKIIFYFTEVIAGAEEQKDIQNAEEYFDGLFDMQITDCKLHVSMYDEISGLKEFKKHLNKIFREVKDKKVVIDFSVMIKPYMFILLKYLQYLKSIEKIYLLYTEPASYHKSKAKITINDGSYFTSGGRKIKEIPSYSGRGDLNKKRALILLLGFEGIRMTEVVRTVEPDITIPINGFPAYRPEFKDISIISNEEILREPEIFKNLDYAPANDPFETKNVLKKIYSKYSDRYNLSISPLGTKPMALGSCLFAIQHTDCRILYSYPIKYNLKSSEGCGTTWLYIVTLRGKMKFNTFVNLILEWYSNHKKKFRWRDTNNPYKILISEILLHKTDSKKVEKVYPKFIEKFPTAYDLYHADPEEIDSLIKDIGLFYRTQRLKKIAEQIVNDFNGHIPNKKEELISLYGVGEYISNAVLCFAFKKRVPIVDTNVIRVYERIFNIKSSKSRARTDKEMWKFAEKMLPEKDYVEYNYALLDFASDICKAKNPLCYTCPINDICEYKRGPENEG